MAFAIKHNTLDQPANGLFKFELTWDIISGNRLAPENKVKVKEQLADYNEITQWFKDEIEGHGEVCFDHSTYNTFQGLLADLKDEYIAWVFHQHKNTATIYLNDRQVAMKFKLQFA